MNGPTKRTRHPGVIPTWQTGTERKQIAAILHVIVVISFRSFLEPCRRQVTGRHPPKKKENMPVMQVEESVHYTGSSRHVDARESGLDLRPEVGGRAFVVRVSLYGCLEEVTTTIWLVWFPFVALKYARVTPWQTSRPQLCLKYPLILGREKRTRRTKANIIYHRASERTVQVSLEYIISKKLGFLCFGDLTKKAAARSSSFFI